MHVREYMHDIVLLPLNMALGNENNITLVPVFNHKTPVASYTAHAIMAS